MGSEDCLYLNIYRPKYAYQGIENLPVMFYIHGGGLFAGLATPDLVGPEYFMDNGQVILVTVAYRLGVFGFLSTGDSEAPGNLGFKDQAVALRWVHDNIKYFGGDPNSVTIFGQSAGGWSVHLHMMSPLSKGLFHRAVIMSGSAIAPYAYTMENPFNQVRQLAEFSNISKAESLSSHQVISELRNINAEQLLDNCDGFKYFFIDPVTIFRNVIERKDSEGAFITEDPLEIARNGQFNYVPLMLTFVQNEGVVRSGQIIEQPAQWDAFTSQIDSILPKLMEFPDDPIKINLVKKFYFESQPITRCKTHRVTDVSLSCKLYY